MATVAHVLQLKAPEEPATQQAPATMAMLAQMV
jgi:hypothetical protein